MTATEAHKGKPGDGTMLEPRAPEWNTARQAEKYCERESPPQVLGVLSCIVLGAWESHVHGEGSDGST
jgi:hypothetical protein